MTNASSLSEFSALQYHPFGGRVSVYLMGKPLDWSISGDDQQEVHSRLALIAKELGIHRILAPVPSKFNAKICDFTELTERIFLTEKGENDIALCRGFDADGVILPFRSTDAAYHMRSGIPYHDRKLAFWLSSADCITVIAHEPEGGCTFATHAGRDCLLDRARIVGETARAHESVVDTIMSRFSKTQARKLKVFMTCGIGPEHFEHKCCDPKYGSFNTRMTLDVVRKWGATCLQGDYFEGRLVLSEIVRAQFMNFGVQPYNIGFDTVDTYSDSDGEGNPKWWSYRRGDGKRRNGVLVVRNW